MSCAAKSVRRRGNLAPNLTDLDETGRMQFFYHSPSSCVPVRDILNEQREDYKTEPYIEKNAENYCRSCAQPNIRGFLRNPEKYLFLLTRCMNRDLKHFGKLYVVGYIVKGCCERRRGSFYAVTGKTRLFSFDDAYPLKWDGNPRHVRKILDRVKTGRILDHFEGKKNILSECLAAVRRLKRRLPEREKRKQVWECK